jgi:hypothetical protein
VTSKLPGIARKSVRGISAATLLFSVLAVTLASPVVSASASNGAISQDYQTSTSSITAGELLSLSSAGSSTVEPANSTTNVARLIGVAADKPLLELSGKGTSSVQVVVGGTSAVLVSDINGSVKVGDKVTASPVSGVGMKAINSAEVVGIAQADLNSVQTVTKSVAGSDGKQVNIKIGLLPIAVIVEYYSVNAASGTASSFVPPFLQTLANQLTGKQVSPLRVLLGMILLIMGFAAVTFMLYVAIRSGIISIGRNPLAEAALRKGLVDVIIAALGVLTITAVVVYGLLLV